MSASAEPTGQGGGVSIPGTIGHVSGPIVGRDFNVSIAVGTVIIQSPPSGALRRSANRIPTVLTRSAPEFARQSQPAKFRFPDHEMEGEAQCKQ